MAQQRSLMLSEQLSIPSFQVVVISADVGCRQCQRRVSQIVSKMTGIKEYIVDVKNKQVIARGDFRERVTAHQEMPASDSSSKFAKRVYRSFKLFLGSVLVVCLCRIIN